MFSVVIPTRNRADLLARAINSLLAQTDDQWDLAVVDDGSDAEEAGRIAALVAEVPGARLIRHATSIGGAGARNAGVAVTRNPIIAFLDSDDWWHPERLARHRSLLGDTRVVLSYDVARGMRPGTVRMRHTGGWAPPAGSPEVALAAWNFAGGCSSVCVRRSAFDAVGGFDPTLRSCQDWDLWLRVAGQGDIVFVPEHLTHIDIGPHPRITTSSGAVEAGHAHMKLCTAKMSLSPAQRRIVDAAHLWTDAEIAVRFGRRRAGCVLMLRSLLQHPSHRSLKRAPSLVLQIFGVLR